MSSRPTASYEWCLETVEGEDIVDHHHEPSLGLLPDPEPDQRIVLVRTWGSDDEGVLGRGYAYPDSAGDLPALFDGGQKIPARLRAQWAKHSAPSS